MAILIHENWPSQVLMIPQHLIFSTSTFKYRHKKFQQIYYMYLDYGTYLQNKKFLMFIYIHLQCIHTTGIYMYIQCLLLRYIFWLFCTKTLQGLSFLLPVLLIKPVNFFKVSALKCLYRLLITYFSTFDN